jgi:hypothetical protein
MKNIRSKVVRESLLDYNTLAKSLQENTEGAVKNLLSETVRDTYAKLLSEDFEKDYEEDDVDMDGEVEDTADAGGSDAAEVDAASADGAEDVDAGMDADAGAEGEEEIPAEGGEESAEGGEELGAEGEADAEGDDWAEFDKYKVSDDEYDFSNAEDEEIVKVYKLMKNDDQILVHKDDDKVKIQDNETGAEYIVDLGGDNEAAGVGAVEPGEDEAEFELETDDDADADFEDAEGSDMGDDFSGEDSEDEFNNDEKDMNESTERMFELVLEYDSNVGYTDNYQKKDVMTTPGMSEPGKNVNDWDAGVPKGKSKPWSGKKGDKSENQPFDGEKGKTVEEGANIEEANLSQSRWNDTHAAHNRVPAANDDAHRRDGIQKTSKGTKYRATGTDSQAGNNVEVDVKVESVMKRVNKTLKENKELKETLNTVMTSLKEAAVTNHNLAQIIKLISENSTTKEEKEEIIRKFANEAKTIDASKTLYESISNDLKKAKKMNITEDKNLSVESSKKINETPIYKSQDIMESLDLMHRMMR